ncbi:DNA repair protein RecO [Fervidibacillus halotolerans]|uniref:DNA repair protein RecO n=1 Tax=Fervidibacillus halotolerans TaxID=2980027 RepID=A0A9E8RXR8_9BACI|nr:DNA repair protein RecO [Fervidibacillus halotolerans]WAA11489.1 DNA repair protein RecO [Fervidibacillus halotolerans]
MFQKIEGIVLRSMDYGEANKIITIFSREFGKIGAVARGAKKPKSRLAPVSQPFTYGYFLVSISSGLGTIQQGEIIESFRGIKEDIFLTAYASYIIELLDKGTEERERNPFLFELVYEILKHLAEGEEPQVLKNIFEIKMLPVLGFRPIVDQCAVCGNREGPFAFSIKEGGIICDKCLHTDPHHLKVSQPVVKLLRLFYHFDIKRLGKIRVKESTKAQLESCIFGLYEEYTGLYLKSKKFIDQLERLK